MNIEYTLDKVNYDPNKCHARQWKNDRSPFHQCKSKQFKDDLCTRCYKKKQNNLLWTGLITNDPPENPICITVSGKTSKKRWDFTKGIYNKVENDHKIENDHKLNIDLEFDFEQLRKESKIIKQKLNQNSKNDHGGAPFAGLLDTTKPIINNDIEFEDYKDLEYEGNTYKLNIHDNQVIDISNVATEYDADKVRLVGIWNEQRETIT